MKLAERIALISAGYKKKEIEAIEAEEAKSLEEHIEEKPAEPVVKTEELPDYKTMYEELQKQAKINEETLAFTKEALAKAEAVNRNNTTANVEEINYIDRIFGKEN